MLAKVDNFLADNNRHDYVETSRPQQQAHHGVGGQGAVQVQLKKELEKIKHVPINLTLVPFD